MLLKLFNLFLQVVISMPSIPSETAYHRDYFYVGGGYADDGNGEHVFKSQMYVEHLVPVGGSRRQYPLLFIHGSAQTGTNWLNKPDGGRGWASYFIDQGYECYIVDQTYRGRSPSYPGSGGRFTLSAERLERFFTAPQKHKIWPEAELHTQWPGSGVMGDPIFDGYFASTVDSLDSESKQQSTIQVAGASLLDRIGRPVILVAHSQAGAQGWVIADARPELVHSLIALEPSGPPFEDYLIGEGPARAWGLADIPVAYSPPVTDPESDLVKKIIPANSTVPRCIIQADNPPARQLKNLSRVKMLVVTAEASYHRSTDWCTVTYLQQGSVPVDHIQLGDIGILGNGHMMFLEKNSDQIAAVLQHWMEKGESGGQMSGQTI